MSSPIERNYICIFVSIFYKLVTKTKRHTAITKDNRYLKMDFQKDGEVGICRLYDIRWWDSAGRGHKLSETIVGRILFVTGISHINKFYVAYTCKTGHPS